MRKVSSIVRVQLSVDRPILRRSCKNNEEVIHIEQGISGGFLETTVKIHISAEVESVRKITEEAVSCILLSFISRDVYNCDVVPSTSA